MAKVNGAPLLVKLNKTKNSRNSDIDGKYYYKAVVLSTLDLDDLADHIQSHGSIYTKDILLGVMTKMRDCIVELVTQNRAVKIDGLGTFYPSLRNRAADDEASALPSENVVGCYIRFRGDSSMDSQLGGTQLRKRIKLTTMSNTEFSTIQEKKKDTSEGGDGDTGGEGTGGDQNP